VGQREDEGRVVCFGGGGSGIVNMESVGVSAGGCQGGVKKDALQRFKKVAWWLAGKVLWTFEKNVTEDFAYRVRQGDW